MSDEPLATPGITPRSMTDEIAALALRPAGFTWWRIAMAPALLLTAVLAVAIVWLFYQGVGIWGIDWPVAWGFAIINYVWWIGIASGGTVISALFYLVGAEWRTAINRIAETMTLFAAACAGIYPILHLGRPWLFFWLFPYPNTMHLWPQFRSPLLWDFFAILAYVISSILFWYFGLIPDLAAMRERARQHKTQISYGLGALGFRGSGRQWRHYHIAYGTMAALMAPLVVSVHSIVGLDFAGAATVGWHSTQFPPFFVVGAILSGFAMVLLLVIPLRRLMRLGNYITARHIDVLARLLLTSALAIGFCYMMDAFTIFYSGEKGDIRDFISKISGVYAPVYWATILLNFAAPLTLAFRAARRSELTILLISAGVVVGMWCERFQIVVMSLMRTHLPSAWGIYVPTFWDWATLFGTCGFFVLGILVCARMLPMIAMFEMREILVKEEETEA